MKWSPTRERARFILATEAALALSGVDALYADSHVLHSVSFTLAPGRVLALLGRNGAGKTTCIHAIVGFVPSHRGEIRLFGETISRLSPEAIARKGVGLVPQGRRIFSSLTVRENLTVASRSRAGVKASWNLERVLDLFPPLRNRQQQLGGSLSGGEQQMLAIGRALMGNPRVLLMDEPSEGLAPLIVKDVGHTIARLKQEGLSILLVEQNVRLAFDLADDVVLVNTGRVVFAGTINHVRDDEALITQHLGVF
jgi:branched-chain amino acid transport system ATP-binding protein